MAVRAYLSNVVRIWPLDKQEAMLAENIPGWPHDVAVYRDEVKPKARRSHSDEALKERATMLRRTSRRGDGSEAIYVASFCVLAWTPEDWMRCMAAAAQRGAAVIALDTGTILQPTAGAQERADAFSEFLAGRRRAQTGEGRKVGALISAAARLADTKTRVALIADDWKRREFSTEALLLRAGRTPKGRRQIVPMAYNTAVLHLGKRRVAQGQHDAIVKRDEKRKNRTIDGDAVDVTKQKVLK